MAARTSARRRVRNQRVSGSAGMYVYGNAVPKPAYEPQRRTAGPERRQHVSRQVKQNRKKAMGINKAYVVFLSVAAILMLVVCVQYVQLRAELTNRSKNITALQEELANLNEANTTKYNAVMDSVNLEEVREKAMDDLGMVYANENQVVEYDNPDGDYIKQYEQIPDEGVVASSAKTNE